MSDTKGNLITAQLFAAMMGLSGASSVPEFLDQLDEMGEMLEETEKMFGDGRDADGDDGSVGGDTDLSGC